MFKNSICHKIARCNPPFLCFRGSTVAGSKTKPQARFTSLTWHYTMTEFMSVSQEIRHWTSAGRANRLSWPCKASWLLVRIRLFLVWTSSLLLKTGSYEGSLPCRGAEEAADHPGPWQHNCCYGNQCLHAMHCFWLPCSHGALVQRRVPPAQRLGFIQPPEQWAAAHIQVRHRTQQSLFFSICFVNHCWSYQSSLDLKILTSKDVLG